VAKKKPSDNNGSIAVLEIPGPDIADAIMREEPTKAIKPDEWRSTSIAEIGLPDYLAARLTHVGLGTVASILDYPGKTGRALSDLSGYKPSEIETINAKVDEFATRMTQLGTPSVEPPSSPPVATAAPDDDAAKWQRDVKAAAGRVESLRANAESKAAVAKMAKKAWEAASEDLTALILEEPAPMPLFDKKPEPAIDAAGESWRSVSLAQLGLAEGLTEKLGDQGFHTIGHLADWTAKGNHLTGINGIGAATAEKIEKALEAYWAEWAKTLKSEEIADADGDDQEDDEPYDEPEGEDETS
jgi:hypothetical protein